MFRTPLPTSRTFSRCRLSWYETICAGLVPPAAIMVRDAGLLADPVNVGLYCATASVSAYFSLSWFRINRRLPEHFGGDDAAAIASAALLGTLLTAASLFLVTRMEAIPRSTLVLQFFLLTTSLLIEKIVVGKFRLRVDQRGDAGDVHQVLVLGVTITSVMYTRMLQRYGRHKTRVIAMLDDDREMIGHSVAGVPILGRIDELDLVTSEFRTHGIRVSNVLVGAALSDSVSSTVQDFCRAEGCKLSVLPDVFDLGRMDPSEVDADQPSKQAITPPITLPAYHHWKRGVDLFASVLLVFLLAPLWSAAGAIAAWDVGTPVHFWQRRVGRRGRNFLLLKIRTLRAPYARDGSFIPEEERLSPIGRFLRWTHLDELPQLLNVLAGDMSLVGPRPLLSRDQPENPSTRLLVRPGITGWAQVNGGAIIGALEKDALDSWYVWNASLALDVRIMLMSLTAFKAPQTHSDPRTLGA